MDADEIAFAWQGRTRHCDASFAVSADKAVAKPFSLDVQWSAVRATEMPPNAISIQTILSNTWKQMSVFQRIMLWAIPAAWEIQHGHPYYGFGLGGFMIYGTVHEWREAKEADREQRYSKAWDAELDRRMEAPGGGYRLAQDATNEMIADKWQPPGFKRAPRRLRS